MNISDKIIPGIESLYVLMYNFGLKPSTLIEQLC